MKLEKWLIVIGIIFGFVSFITLFKKPSYKIWLPLYILNCVVNYLFDKTLVITGQVKYPIRFWPNFTRINVVYDYLVCPYLSIWFCQSTYNDKLPNIIKKLLLFSAPQAIYEIILERKTDALKFLSDWKWMYSFLLVFVVKIISRCSLEFIKNIYNNNEQRIV